jgi:hypothetical protein
MRSRGGTGERAGILFGTGAALLGWAVLCACVPHPSADPSCVGSSVKGEHTAVFVAPTGEMLRVYTAQPAAALLPLSAGRGYVTCPGTDDGNGALSVPNVPDGPYYFQQGSTFVQTSERDVDFSDYFLGRPNGVSAKLSTPATLQVSNLETWSTMNDSLSLYSWGARVYQFGVETLGTGAPSDGATQATLAFDWSLLDAQHLLTPADQLLVTQYAQRNITGGTAQLAVRQAVISGKTMLDGASTSLSASLAPLTANQPFSFTWSRSAFDAHSLDVAPDSTSSDQVFFVEAVPAGSQHGDYDLSLDILQTGFPTVGQTDVALGGNLPAGPNGFTLLGQLQERLFVQRSFRGLTTQLTAFVFVEDTLANLDGTTVKPRTSPVKSPKIGGADALSVQSGVGTTPVISWNAPDMPPDVVRMFVRHLIVGADGTLTSELTATIFTTDTSVQIPDGLLKSGETYFLYLDALSAPGASFGKAPFHYGTALTSVRVVSETFTP